MDAASNENFVLYALYHENDPSTNPVYFHTGSSTLEFLYENNENKEENVIWAHFGQMLN